MAHPSEDYRPHTEGGSRCEPRMLRYVSQALRYYRVGVIPPLFKHIRITSALKKQRLFYAPSKRSNILYRLNSGRDGYSKNGGKLGRKPGLVKTSEQDTKENKSLRSLRNLRTKTKLLSF